MFHNPWFEHIPDAAVQASSNLDLHAKIRHVVIVKSDGYTSKKHENGMGRGVSGSYHAS